MGAADRARRQHIFHLKRVRGPGGGNRGQSSDSRGGREQQAAAFVQDFAHRGSPWTSIRSTFSG
jgi:hypothetical protein